MTDWKPLRDEYISGSGTLRELAECHGVSYDMLKRVSAVEGWRELRTKRQFRRSDEGFQTRIEDITDRLLDQIQKATEELELATVVTKTKEKLEFGERTTEERQWISGDKVDVKDLKTLTDALRIIRDLRFPKSMLDIREQEAKIRNLERQLEDRGASAITVTLAGEMEDFAG